MSISLALNFIFLQLSDPNISPSPSPSPATHVETSNMDKFEDIASEIKDFLTSKIFSSFDIDNDNLPTYAQIIVASSIGLIIIFAMHIWFRRGGSNKIMPWIRVSKSRQPLKLEKFHDYVGIKIILALFEKNLCVREMCVYVLYV